MAAVLAEGETVLQERRVSRVRICRFLVLGAEIEGIGANVLHIGASKRSAASPIASVPSTSRWRASSAWRRSPARTSRLTAPPWRPARRAARLRAACVKVEWDGDSIHVLPAGLVIRTTSAARSRRSRTASGCLPVRPDLDRRRCRYPGAARSSSSRRCSRTGCSSSTSWSGWVIIICDPHRVVVRACEALRRAAGEPDIRAGMAMLIASLCAEGVSTIGNIAQIDRGYERIDERLRSSGAVGARRHWWLARLPCGGDLGRRTRERRDGHPGARSPRGDHGQVRLARPRVGGRARLRGAAEASAAGWALGEALHRHLRGEGAAGYGSISMPAERHSPRSRSKRPASRSSLLVWFWCACRRAGGRCDRRLPGQRRGRAGLTLHPLARR